MNGQMEMEMLFFEVIFSWQSAHRSMSLQLIIKIADSDCESTGQTLQTI